MSKKDAATNELDILLPEKGIIINGETIEVRPFHFSKLPKVIEAVSKIGTAIYELMAHEGLQVSEQGNLIINQALLETASKVFEENFGVVAELMALYTGKTAAFYLDEENGVSGEDGLILLLLILERNYDFFTNRLASAIERIKAKAKK